MKNLNCIRAYIKSLVENIDLNSDLDEFADEMLAADLTLVSIQVKSRLAELGISGQALARKANVSKHQVANLINERRLPSLNTLKKLSAALNCDLVIKFAPTHAAANGTTGASCTISPSMDELQALAEVNKALSLITLRIETKYGYADLKCSKLSEEFDSFFSTQQMCRSAASRLHLVSIQLLASKESPELNASAQ
jgi:transcriptional regulator with XRE-family HTH domain